MFSDDRKPMMAIDDAPGSPVSASNPYEEMPIERILQAEQEIDRLHDQHLNGGTVYGAGNASTFKFTFLFSIENLDCF